MFFYFYCDELVNMVALIKAPQDETVLPTKVLDCLGRERIDIPYVTQYCCNTKLKKCSGALDLCVL